VGQRAGILTIGNEVVSGDVNNTNAAWLAQRLETLGVRVVLSAAVPDEIEAIADFVRRERGRVDVLLVTGGLGGTPDDITREAIAAAFEVRQEEVGELAAELRQRFPRHPDYAARWACLPAGSRPLRNPHGGAPGFSLENVWVLPGLPSEMEAMFDAYADRFRGDQPISSWRRAFRTRESDIVHLLTGATVRWPKVSIGSYPRFLPEGPEVEIVLKSGDPKALAAAVAWLEPQLDAVLA
jgi:nicotinamide-nucleotide amidase